MAAVQRLALRIEPRRWVIVVGSAIAVLLVLGILRFAHKDSLRLFNLDGEKNLPSTFSALLWVCVAVLAFLIGRVQTGSVASVWKVISALLFLLAIDEFGEVHEHLQYHAGVDWQILYAPIGLAGAVLWFVVGRRLRPLGEAFWAFVGATVCLVVAQPLEALEIDSNANPRPGFRVMVVTEEGLEMLGALLLGLSFLMTLRVLALEPARPRT